MKGIKILALNELAEKSEGCIRFDKGSAKFPFPEEFLPHIDRVKKELTNHYFHYPKIGGEEGLKKQIVRLEQKNGRKMLPENIVVTHGGMSGLFTFFSAVTKPGDEVVTNIYSFEGFSTVIDYFRLKQKRVDLSNISKVKKAISKKTRAIIFNSPENPTGKVYSQKEVENFVRLANQAKIFFLSDEVMNKIIYEGTAWHGPTLKTKYEVAVNSFSKSWFIPGIRLGWLATKNEKLVQSLANSLVSQSIGVSLFSQLFLTSVCENINYSSFLKKRLAILERRRGLVKKYLVENNIEYLSEVAGGTNFYINLKEDTTQLAYRLINKYKVAVIPGVLFEGKKSTWARLGFGAVDEKNIKGGLSLILQFLQH